MKINMIMFKYFNITNFTYGYRIDVQRRLARDGWTTSSSRFHETSISTLHSAPEEW